MNRSLNEPVRRLDDEPLRRPHDVAITLVVLAIGIRGLAVVLLLGLLLTRGTP